MAGYEVRAVQERPAVNEAGQLVSQTVMYLVTDRGATGQVVMPTSDFEALTADAEGKNVLRQMLEQKAASLNVPFEM